MTNQDFWEIVKKARDASPSDAAEGLRAVLMGRSLDEVVAFDTIFDELFAKAYLWDLWGAAYLIEGGCSDDGFIDFRYGLISLGEEIYTRAIADPDSLADFGKSDARCVIPYEEYGYVAREVYEARCGEEMPERETTHPAEPAGDDWDFESEEQARERLPRLFAQFG